jgi:superfamily II DNA or RNA helicase
MLRDCSFELSYSSGLQHGPKEFFTEALIESKSFDLGLGFFSTSGIRCLAYGFALFIANGGRMRVVINHILSEQDKLAIEKGQSGIIDSFEDKILNNVTQLCNTLSRQDEQFFNCFSYLISVDRIEFVATVSTQGGLGHDKYGVFTDERGNKVAFSGSANFSQTAMELNSETITVFTSWQSPEYVKDLETKFNYNWHEDNDHLIHIPISKVTSYIKDKFGSVKLKNLLDREIDLRDVNEIDSSDPIISKPLPEYLVEKMEFKEQEPRFPFPSERSIQIDAYKAWIENNRNGIFAMATGSGKTVTALNCLLKQYQENGFYKAIIVVPTKALALQWEDEVKHFNFQNIVSTHTEKDWKNLLSRYTTKSLLNQRKNIVIITTYATFIRKYIQDFIRSTKGIESFVFIADEAHNLGATGPIKHLPNNIKYRIGLSATPERIYDDGGSKKLYDFFNSKPPKYTYRFTMKDAIWKSDPPILCHYEYYPLFVSLTHSEMEEYNKVTEQLRKFIDPKTGKYKKEAEKKLMERKRIIHKAENKKQKVAELLDEQKKKGTLDYTFVFVPEGYEPDYAEIDDHNIDNEDIHIIDEYSQMFRERRYSYHQYISGLDDAPSILDSFERGDIQILLSMKCLDEGVDIPRAQNAIFISSTGNPRQFIQRRGRVLRTCKGKDMAYIWDLIVMPPDISESASTVERSLFTGEVRRILNFAALADNKIDILYGELKQVCDSLNIPMFDLLDTEEEQYN